MILSPQKAAADPILIVEEVDFDILEGDGRRLEDSQEKEYGKETRAFTWIDCGD